MSNAIIVIILAIAVFAGIKETIKHFKGEGACCGGSSSKPRKKKLSGPILHSYIVQIEGMHCQNCVNAVTRAINEIDGASAKVSLKKKTAKVICDRDVDIDVIRDAIRKRGYEVLTNKDIIV